MSDAKKCLKCGEPYSQRAPSVNPYEWAESMHDTERYPPHRPDSLPCLERQLAQAEERERRLRQALPDPEALRAMAEEFDGEDIPQSTASLYIWADNIEAAMKTPAVSEKGGGE